MAEQSQVTGAIGGAGQGATIGSAFGPIGTGVGAVVGGIGGFLGGGGEDEAEKMAEEQAYMIRRVAKENERTQRMEMKRTLGETKARTYASNLLDTGSSRQYRNVMEQEATRNIRFNAEMSEIQAQQALKGGEFAADTIKRAGVQSAVQGLTSLGVSTFGSGKAPGATTQVGPKPTSGSQSGSVTTNPFTKKTTDRSQQSIVPQFKFPG
jgi:hypothetical protein